MSAVAVEPSAAWTRATYRLSYLVLDPGLQCRAGLQPEIVDDYVAAAEGGAVFPPPRAVVVDDRAFVVDGWHRVAMHQRLGTVSLEVECRPGTRRDALLEAARANSTHGLQRTREDRRRALRILLQDPEWCALSGRQLAELAGVSHTLVDQARKRYGVAAGEVLTEARATEVDGEPSAAWRALISAAPSWDRPWFEAVRTAKGVRELLVASRNGYSSGAERAISMRLDELGTDDWPWPDGAEPARTLHAQRLDTADSLIAAISSRECPNRPALFHVLALVGTLDHATQLDQHEEAFAGRPALLAMLWDRRTVLGAKTDPYEATRRIYELPPAKQAIAVRDAPADVYRNLSGSRLDPSVRDGEYRLRAGKTLECADPKCDGWARVGQYQLCVICHVEPAEWRRQARESLRDAGALLRRPGYSLSLGGVTVDHLGVELLRELWLCTTDQDDTWLRAAPAPIRDAMRKWQHTHEDVVLSVDPDHEDEDEVEPDEDDAGDDSDGPGDEE